MVRATGPDDKKYGQYFVVMNVCFGSLADMARTFHNVRFTPESGWKFLLSAKSGRCALHEPCLSEPRPDKN